MKTVYEKNGSAVNILQDSDIKGDEGYVQYPDGTMILYGVGKIENTGEASIHINFPKNFIDSGYSVSIQNIFSYNSEIIYSIAGINTNGFDLYASKAIDVNTKSIDFKWIAIGRWK